MILNIVGTASKKFWFNCFLKNRVSFCVLFTLHVLRQCVVCLFQESIIFKDNLRNFPKMPLMVSWYMGNLKADRIHSKRCPVEHIGECFICFTAVVLADVS